MRSRASVFVLVYAACARPPAAVVPSADPISTTVAAAQLAEAAAACERDAGRLWGRSLCGPVMFVDRASRFVVANAPDGRAVLRRRGAVFVGTLPPDQNIANTAFTWNDVHWTQVVWPLPATASARATLLLHEMFHRIQPELGFANDTVDNRHLGTVEGRYTMQLEWRALAQALRAATDLDRRTAALDALAFRAARRASVSGAATTEDALELHEGLAEYTGVRLGATDPVAAALHDLSSHVDDKSFVRSFAYATGPAYGLLLDRFAPTWRSSIRQVGSLSSALAKALGATEERDVAQRGAVYDGPALHAAEVERGAKHEALIARYRARLIDGPVATLPLAHMQMQFDPNEVESLGDAGSVYPTLRVVDDWGVLVVSDMALIRADFSAVVVPGPAGATGGPGWTLELAPRYRWEDDRRPGDRRLAATP